jgi:hypothetical protein
MAGILEVLKNQINSVEACLKYGFKQPELEEWTECFLSGGENELPSNPRDDQAQHEAEIKELHAKVSVLVLDALTH